MAWDDLDITQKLQLFETRTKIGKQRQPEWSRHLDSLESIIIQKKVHDTRGKLIQTPFEEFSLPLFECFCKCESDFEFGGNWIDANFDNPIFFYRIETLSSFLGKHKDLYSDYSYSSEALNINPIFQSNEIIFEEIFNAFMTNGTWLELERFVKHFQSRRNISWWSNDFSFDQDRMFPKELAGSGITQKHKWIVDFAFRVGLSSDWLSDSLLFLRLDSSKMSKTNFKVPSVLDAYTQPIFSPQINNKLEHGKAFDLANDVKPRTREYVVKEIPIDAISFIPVRINEKELDNISSQPRINRNLIKNLIANI